MTKTMADAVDPSALARYGTDAVAGYVNGRWPTYNTARSLGKPTLSIAVSADPTISAQCLDVEPGDATPSQAAAWVDRQRARGVEKPWVYCARGDAGRVRSALGSRRYILWVAHPDGGGAHLCSRARGCGVDADATQHTWRADVDLTLMSDAAWATLPGAGHVSKSATTTTSGTVLKVGSRGAAVATLQRELMRLFPAYAAGPIKAAGGADGVYGTATAAVVGEFQRRAGGLVIDREAGPATIAALRRYGARL